MEFDKTFWSERYKNNLLGWDAGAITTPIKDYVDQLTDKETPILIPGCGQGHEAAYLHDQGFSNVTVIDLVDQPIQNLRERCPNWSDEQFVIGDFFAHKGEYEIILEQTFFCAIEPNMRQQYAEKIYSLLIPGGKLVGLLFVFPLTQSGPPFGGSQEEYKEYFSAFEVQTMAMASNSIKPRRGKELFINLRRPN